MSEQEMKMPEGFVDPTGGYGGARFQRWKLEDGVSLVLRPLPAMKSLRSKREIAEFWVTHFILGRNPKDSTKTRTFPVLGIEESKFENGARVVTKRDPLVDKRIPIQAKVDAAFANGKRDGLSRQEVAKTVAKEQAWLKDHGSSGGWNLYAIDKQGQFGVLKLSHTAMKAFREEMRRLLQDGFTPAGVKGLFFKFRQNGKGFGDPITYKIEVNRIQKENGDEAKDVHVLTPELAATALEVLPDFNEEKERIHYSDETMAKLAACSGDPDEVLAILQAEKPNLGQDRKQTQAPVTGDDLPDHEAPEVAAASTNTEVEKAAAEETAEDEEAALERQLAEAKARKAAKATPAAQPAAGAGKLDKAKFDSLFKKKGAGAESAA